MKRRIKMFRSDKTSICNLHIFCKKYTKENGVDVVNVNYIYFCIANYLPWKLFFILKEGV